LLLAQHSSEGGEQGGGASNQIWWKWANFAILAGGLGYLVYKKGGAFFVARSEAIRKGIEEADHLRREAEQRVAEMEGRLKNLEQEVEELRTKARDEMAAENERLRCETEASLKKVRQQADQEIASAVKAARDEVRMHAAELAVDLAAGKIRAALTPKIDESLALAFLDSLAEKADAKPDKELN
jgi:F-type H+-transporting ATPase subunit b